jgi:superfamily I DNA/RNA helicase
LLEGYVRSLQFNKHIANEAVEAFRGTCVSVSTIHAAGMQITRRQFPKTRVEPKKYAWIVEDFIDEANGSKTLEGSQLTEEEREGLQRHEAPNGMFVLARKFVDLCRLTLTAATAEGIESLANHYGVEVEPHQWALLVRLVGCALDMGKKVMAKAIDFTDMVWAPSALNLHGDKFDWVLVDEAQDLNAAQFDIALRLLKPDGRMLVVGDPQQAIYGFAGADTDSFWNIQRRLGAKVLPLSICYRCPRSHVELAQEIVSTIEAAPNAIDGMIAEMDRSDLLKNIEPDHVVMCRNTAPLIKLCYKILLAGKPAYVAGRAIAEGIVKSLDESVRVYRRKHKKAPSVDELGTAFDLWNTKVEASFKRQKIDEEDMRWQRHADRLECLRIFWGQSDASSVSGFKAEIEDLFREDRKATRLCTVHRAKGLEAEVTYILDPDLMPSPYARTAWEQQQERHLQYVAHTRSTSEMYFVY